MSTEKINLLIVDDEEDFLNSIRRSLEVRGFNVTAVNSGEKAIAAAKDKTLDIALVDLKMPGIDGKQTLELLKKERQWMEIIILTGHGTIDSAAECSRLGAFSYLQKPCELDRLLEALAEAFKKRVMNKTKIREKQMNEMLAASQYASPRALLEKLKELDQTLENV